MLCTQKASLNKPIINNCHLITTCSEQVIILSKGEGKVIPVLF